MEQYWKTIGIAFLTLILAVVLERQGKDFSILLSLAASCMLAVSAARFLEPVMTFFSELEALGDVNSGVLLTLLKIIGVGLTGEISSSVCTDGGSSALGKGIKLLTNSAVFFLSLPLFTSLLELIRVLLWEF